MKHNNTKVTQTVLMKTFFFWAIFFSTQFSATYAKNTSQEAAVQQYYQDQSIKQIEQFIPKGKFSVQVKAEIDYRKIQQENESPTMGLPMLGAVVPQDSKSEGGVQTSIDELLHYVKKVEISVKLAPEVSKQAKDMISNSISNMVTFDPKRGDKINFDILPSSMNETTSAFQQPFFIMGASLFFAMLMITFMVLFGMNRIAAIISREFNSISNKFRESFEGGGMPSASINGSPQLSQSISQVNFDNVEGYQQGASDFWERIDPASITAFIFDSHSVEKMKAIPYILVNGLYNRDLVEFIEKTIPSSFFQISEHHQTFSMTEIHQFYQKHHAEYRKVQRSILAKTLLNVEVEKLQEYSSKFDSKEMVLLVNALTPFKRARFVSMLDVNTKMQLVKISKSALSVEDFKKYESNLIDKVTKISESPSQKENYDFSTLSEFLFKSSNFQEDEANFKIALNEPGFFSPLMCLNAFSKEDWDEFTPQESALAFWGYSDEYKAQLVEKYKGKKHEWIKNFLNKFEHARPDFDSIAVDSVREKLKAKYHAVRTAGDKSENEKAS